MASKKLKHSATKEMVIYAIERDFNMVGLNELQKMWKNALRHDGELKTNGANSEHINWCLPSPQNPPTHLC